MRETRDVRRETTPAPPLPRGYRRALGASLGLHGAMLCLIIFAPMLMRSKPLIDESQVLMAELIEIQPSAPEKEAQPAPAPKPPPPKPPPPKPPPKSLPEPSKKPKKHKSEDPRKKKMRELAARRRARDVQRVKVPEKTYQAPAPRQAVTGRSKSNPVRAKGKAFPYDYYLVLVRNALWEVWRPPRVQASQGIASVVSFKILRDGSVPLGSISISQHSGIEAYDQSCMRAVQNAQLPPLPQDYRDSSLTLDCIFRSEES